MSYTVNIDEDQLIELLQDHYDDKVYESIKEDDRITRIELRHRTVEIVIGEEEA